MPGSARRTPADRAARVFDDRRRRGAGRERARRRAAGRPRVGASEGGGRGGRRCVVARVAREGAVRDALAQAARSDLLPLGPPGPGARPAADPRRRPTGTSPTTTSSTTTSTPRTSRHIIRGIFEGIINPEWHKRIDKQLDDDAGGYGEQNSIAIFGKPGSEEVRVRDDRPAHDDPLRRQLGRARRLRRADLLRPRGRRLRRRARLTPATSSGRRPRRPTSSTKCSTASSSEQALVRQGLAERIARRLPRQGRQVPRARRSPSCRATRRSTCRK